MAEEETAGEAQQEGSQWQYIAVVDERTCLGCLQYDGQIFSFEEIESLFPNATQLDDQTFQVNQHPNCRCQLVKVAEGEAEAGAGAEAVARARAGFVFWPSAGVGRLAGSAATRLGLGRISGPVRRLMTIGVRELATVAPEAAAALYMIAPIIATLTPIINEIVRAAVQAQMEAETRRQIEEHEKRRAKIYREVYRSIIGE
jgi:hypothetical protein